MHGSSISNDRTKSQTAKAACKRDTNRWRRVGIAGFLRHAKAFCREANNPKIGGRQSAKKHVSPLKTEPPGTIFQRPFRMAWKLQ
jgi:hypothetical protein